MTGFAERFGGAALITGASSGIGEVFARALAARGMDLVLVARREDRLRRLGDELAQAYGVRALPVVQDVAVREAPQVLRAVTEEAGLQVGLLVNNAGFTSYGAFQDFNDGSHARMVDLHCGAPLALTEAFLPDMVARGRGGIIFVASMAGFQPTPYMAVYGATKAFKLSLAEALWVELRPRGIDVLGLCPGFVDTEFHELAGTHDLPRAGALSAEVVVERALAALGRRSSVVPGALNRLMLCGVRVLPRSWVAALAGRSLAPKHALPKQPAADDKRGPAA